ncbi:MAG: M48 family metallopeptidase [Rhodospirillaceae bacterium]|nr:M48 family metallopeptidase [Rhodospirillaceae bacterium]
MNLLNARDTVLLADTPLRGALDPILAARVVVEINQRARRISVRVDPSRSCVVLVYPRRAPQRTVAAFVASRADWIAKHLDALPSRVSFSDGAVIPYVGIDHVIRLRPEARGGVWREDGQIIVAGRAEHGARRVRDWLKSEARTALTARVYAMAARIDVKVAQVGVRDTVSRWGSCSTKGKLSFSWRLIFAPEDVLTYVAAHEVAHLKHMDHSRAFWRTVMRILEEEKAAVNWTLARQWLRRGGTALHRYG